MENALLLSKEEIPRGEESPNSATQSGLLFFKTIHFSFYFQCSWLIAAKNEFDVTCVKFCTFTPPFFKKEKHTCAHDKNIPVRNSAQLPFSKKKLFFFNPM